MPLIIRTDRDLEFAQRTMVERRDMLGCDRCNPATWDPDGAKERWPCKSPMCGVICTNPKGDRELMYEQCSLYRNWAEERKKSKEEKGKKTWKKRTWNQ